MGETLTLTAADGHELAAYKAEPEDGKPCGGIVVIQEIFGVNGHIRDVTDRFAEAGYTAIAPALFDRWKRGVELDYIPEDIPVGREFKATANADLDSVMADVKAAHENVSGAGRVGITGYCWGGFVSWAAACRLNFDAAACYYGGGIADMIDAKPNCPTILHFGRNDASVPVADAEKIKEAHPDCPVYLYDAGHGFNCDRRADFNAEASQAALVRTMDLFRQHVG